LTTMGRISHSNDGCFPNPQLTSPMHHPHIRHLVFGLDLLFNFTNHFFSHRRIGAIFQSTHSFPLMMVTYCSDKDADSTTFRKVLNTIKILHPKSSLLDSGKLFEWFELHLSLLLPAITAPAYCPDLKRSVWKQCLHRLHRRNVPAWAVYQDKWIAIGSGLQKPEFQTHIANSNLRGFVVQSHRRLLF